MRRRLGNRLIYLVTRNGQRSLSKDVHVKQEAPILIPTSQQVDVACTDGHCLFGLLLILEMTILLELFAQLSLLLLIETLLLGLAQMELDFLAEAGVGARPLLRHHLLRARSGLPSGQLSRLVLFGCLLSRQRFLLRLPQALRAKARIMPLQTTIKAEHVAVMVQLLRIGDLLKFRAVYFLFLAVGLLVAVFAAVVANDGRPLLLLLNSTVVAECHRSQVASIISARRLWLLRRPVLGVREVCQLLERRHFVNDDRFDMLLEAVWTPRAKARQIVNAYVPVIVIVEKLLGEV